LAALFWSADEATPEALVVLNEPLQPRDDPEDPVGMAYAPGRRIGRFSNPNKQCRGVATGSESANNVKLLNAGVEVVSGYR